ncbi:transporter [Flavobacterium magnum]|uniref:Transporter n=1 Tax=Flavobacterium magnum TaxID=2162713 RepID=A0A2S0RDD7_9FLAO|nr:TolC family protein [Flavobacterium magnum]AWA29549.1 transporter [Flavobacterium magnum]
MRKIKNYIGLFLLVFSVSVQAQNKKWTILECVEYALQHNISIRQTELDTMAAKIDGKDAIGNFLPSVNANASHSWNIGLNQNITTGLLENQTTQFTSAGLNMGIDIYRGMQNQNRLSRARLSLIASQYQLKKMRDDVSLNVANAFLQILFNKENLKVQKELLQNNEKQQTRTRELVNAGSVPRGDLLDTQATVAGSKQAVVLAENTLLISKLSLAQLLQLEDYENFDIADENFDVQDSPTMMQTPHAIYEKAKEERAEIKIAKTNLEIAEKDVKIARAGFQPSLTGYYSFSTRASYSDRIIGVDGNGNPIVTGPQPLFDQFSDNKGHSFGLQLNVPILNGFTVRNSVARSKISLERYKIAYSQQELDLQRNVYTAFTDAKGALNSYEAAVSALEARTEAFNYAKEKFNVGLMNAFDLNQAQTLFANAQSEVLRAKYDYIFRVKVVEFYFGIPITKK